MHFFLSLFRINSLCMLPAILARHPEELHIHQLVYFVRIMSAVGYRGWSKLQLR
jgi:hypothetical protein